MRITIKDCDVQTFRAGGNGGQNQNKRDTGVRVLHRASGAVGEARDARGQLQNKRNAFSRMAKSAAFQEWAKMRLLGDRETETASSERVRTYNLAKKYIKDHRTGKRTTEVDAVLNGDLGLIR